MARLRDDFSANVKMVLGNRVAFRCCFPGCGVLTIGPNFIDDTKHIVLGQAAHIHAASPLGPRYDAKMTPAERSGFQNGIWMCGHHAKLIDADKDNYSAETIRQWKQIAEAETYRQLKELTNGAVPAPSTIICLHPRLMFEGIWASADDDSWRFLVKNYIYGSEEELKAFQLSGTASRKDFVIIESQGDGRLIHETFRWEQQPEGIEFSVKVLPSAIRRNPNFIGSAPAMGERMLENGRMRLISGKELAVQKIGFLLNSNQGTRFFNRGYGTLFNFYYHDHRDNPALLNRLIKVELTRLISIPTNPEEPAGQPELNFINRIHEVRLGKEEDGRLSVWLSLEWGDGSPWEGILTVHVEEEPYQPAAPSPRPVQLQPRKVRIQVVHAPASPLAQLKALTKSMTGDELKVKKNEGSIMELFRVVMPAIMDKANELLHAEVFPLFNHHIFYRMFEHSTYEYNTSYDLELRLLKGGMIHEMGISLSLKGFKKAGVKAFDVYGNLLFFCNDYSYKIGASQSDPWLEKLYDQQPTPQEIEAVANGFIDNVLRKVNENIIAISSY